MKSSLKSTYDIINNRIKGLKVLLSSLRFLLLYRTDEKHTTVSLKIKTCIYWIQNNFFIENIVLLIHLIGLRCNRQKWYSQNWCPSNDKHCWPKNDNHCCPYSDNHCCPYSDKLNCKLSNFLNWFFFTIFRRQLEFNCGQSKKNIHHSRLFFSFCIFSYHRPLLHQLHHQ